MLLLLCSSVILYRKVYHLDESEIYFTTENSFGFEKGGNLSIQIANGTGSYLVLLTKKLRIYDFIERIDYLGRNFAKFYDSRCYIFQNFLNASSNALTIIETKNGYGKYTFTINEPGNYDALIMTCSLPIMNLSLYLTYLNPNSCLSTSVHSCIKVFPKLIIVLSVIFVIWMINWFCYFTLANVFHLFVTIYLFANILDKIFMYYDLLYRDKSDFINPIAQTYKIFFSIKNFFFFFIIIMPSNENGLPIYWKSLIFLITCLLSLFLATPLYFEDKIDSVIFWFFYIIIVFIVLSIGIFPTIFYERMALKYVLAFIGCFAICFELFFKYSTSGGFVYIFICSLIVFHPSMYVLIYIFYRLNNDEFYYYYKIWEIKYGDAPDEGNLYISPNARVLNRSLNMNVKNVIFPKNTKLENISNFAFYGTKIKCITIPSTVKKIGEYAFSTCDRLSKVDFDEKSNLKTFESNIFCDSAIDSLYIPSSLIELKNNWCFKVCNLVTIEISPENKYFKYYNNSFIIGKTKENQNEYDILFFARRNIIFAVIPSFIQKIASCAFQNCKMLKKVEFSDDSNLKLIEQGAFSFTSIEEIIIPKSVRIIGDHSFQNCLNLKYIIFLRNSKLNFIGFEAFADCSSLESFTIPSNVIHIGQKAFCGCSKLKTIEIKNDSKLISFDNSNFDDQSSVTIFASPEDIDRLKL